MLLKVEFLGNSIAKWNCNWNFDKLGTYWSVGFGKLMGLTYWSVDAIQGIEVLDYA